MRLTERAIDPVCEPEPSARYLQLFANLENPVEPGREARIGGHQPARGIELSSVGLQKFTEGRALEESKLAHPERHLVREVGRNLGAGKLLPRARDPRGLVGPRRGLLERGAFG